MEMVATLQSLYIDGEWATARDRDVILNPADESVLGEAPVGNAGHVDAALAAAHTAFHHGPWPHLSANERQAKLTAFLDAIDRRSGEIIDLIVAEAGSTRGLAQFLQYATPMKHARTTLDVMLRPAQTALPIDLTPAADGSTMLGGHVLSREPVGVVSAITAYNFPFFLNIGKIIPAMAAGCTVVLKPSPYTPFEALILGQIAEEVGLPRGVLNIVTGGADVGAALTTDKRVDLVTFTGSDTVGAAIQAQAAPTLKRVLLELGGKSALIVRADADIQQAAMAGVMGFTIHCGQGCALTTRHIVHNAIRARYVEAVKQMIGAMKIGNPSDPSVQLGPLIREQARTRSESYVEIARAEGARLVAGGKRPAGFDKGFFFEPTLFNDVDNAHRIAQEEVFGPIGVVIGFDTDEEAIRIANDSNFGLGGGIYSRDAGKAYAMALAIRAGGVAINGGAGTMSSHAPFGGIKRSGYGREYGIEGLNEFTYMKSISFHAA
ncbi:aldehyde dehydrogenase [Novosphingobium pokkalii]|nr:aldehyde dehydrogenase [Novosphingobium pokkalii]